MPSPPNPPIEAHVPFLRLQSITIFVRDIDRSILFYTETLGFQLVFDARNGPGRPWAVIASPARDSAEFKLIGRHTHISFVTEDVPGKFREWIARGVQFSSNPRLKRLQHGVRVHQQDPVSSGAVEQSPIWGGVFSSFRDPDG